MSLLGAIQLPGQGSILLRSTAHECFLQSQCSGGKNNRILNVFHKKKPKCINYLLSSYEI